MSSPTRLLRCRSSEGNSPGSHSSWDSQSTANASLSLGLRPSSGCRSRQMKSVSARADCKGRKCGRVERLDEFDNPFSPLRLKVRGEMQSLAKMPEDVDALLAEFDARPHRCSLDA
jgi:hypothetical protein